MGEVKGFGGGKVRDLGGTGRLTDRDTEIVIRKDHVLTGPAVSLGR